MTEKRFHFGYVLGDTGLIDEKAEIKWFIENCCSVSDLKKNWNIVCDKLNEVSDENEQLRRNVGKQQEEIEILSEENKQLKRDRLENYKAYKKLLNEKEQLKQQCERHRRNFRAMEDVKCELAEENNELKEAMKRMMIEMMGGKP